MQIDKVINEVAEVKQETMKLFKEYFLVLYPQYIGFKSVLQYDFMSRFNLNLRDTVLPFISS